MHQIKTKTLAEVAERNKELARDYEDGRSLQALAKTYRLTRERVNQILAAMGVTRRKGGGQPYARRHAPLAPSRSFRQEIAERLRALRAGEV